MSCTHLKTCPLFAHFARHPALSIWQSHYCESGFKKCARHSASMGGLDIPVTLLPNGKMLKTEQDSKHIQIAILFNAIRVKKMSTVSFYLDEMGLAADVRNPMGMTGLMYAAEVGFMEVVGAFLAHRADVHLTNKKGETAYDIAKRCGHEGIAQLLELKMATAGSQKKSA